MYPLENLSTIDAGEESSLDKLLEYNKKWAKEMELANPMFFKNLAKN